MSQNIDRPDRDEDLSGIPRPGSRAEALWSLGDGRWAFRLGAVLWLHEVPDPEGLRAMIPLTRDPKRKVRQLAAFAVGCQRERGGLGEAVPLLMERVLEDSSIKVRRLATQVLAFQHAHPDLMGFFQSLLDQETDEKLHRAAGVGLFLSRKAASDGDTGEATS